MENHIINNQNIINTYDERQQNQCKLYYQYKQIKQENSSFGYKKISKLLNQQQAKTRWWHCGKHLPVPVQTANWLEEKSLIPLHFDNTKLKLIAKVLGTTFGDGGIFENLNGIFLSSSEIEAVKEFGEDLNLIFGKEIEKNSRIFESGEKGHSWCYQNTNRNIIRFFIALGAPFGRKTTKELIIPEWVFTNEELADEFFGAYIGNEGGIPKMHIEGCRLNTLDVSICGSPKLEMNRYKFLNQIRRYFDMKGIRTCKICQSSRKDTDTITFRLFISLDFENVLNFYTLIKINYCKYKAEKLEKTIQEFARIKLQRHKDLSTERYDSDYACKLLNISPKMLDILQNEIIFGDEFEANYLTT